MPCLDDEDRVRLPFRMKSFHEEPSIISKYSRLLSRLIQPEGHRVGGNHNSGNYGCDEPRRKLRSHLLCPGQGPDVSAPFMLVSSSEAGQSLQGPCRRFES